MSWGMSIGSPQCIPGERDNAGETGPVSQCDALKLLKGKRWRLSPASSWQCLHHSRQSEESAPDKRLGVGGFMQSVCGHVCPHPPQQISSTVNA